MSKKIEEITDKIEANKEVLSTMPKNNIKNMDIYQKKLEELEEEFKKYTKKILVCLAISLIVSVISVFVDPILIKLWTSIK